MSTRELIEEVVEMHGGWERWARVHRIRAQLSLGGFIFSSHRQPAAFRELEVIVSPRAPSVLLRGFGGEGYAGRWTPRRAQLINPDGALIADRLNPRSSFTQFKKNFAWDALDVVYFTGYSLWNYLSFPFQLDTPDVKLTEFRAPDASSLDKLTAQFDHRLPTHSIQQTYHFNERRQLVRHDYTVDVIGALARVSNVGLTNEAVAGLRFYTRHEARLRLGQSTLPPFPTLLWFALDDLEVEYAD